MQVRFRLPYVGSLFDELGGQAYRQFLRKSQIIQMEGLFRLFGGQLPQERRPVLGRDDQTSDTQVDVMTEEQLLRGMESLTPTEPSANGGTGSGRG